MRKFIIVAILIVASVKVVGATENQFSQYGENTKVAKIMADNSHKGGV